MKEINIKKVIPVMNNILITAHKYSEEDFEGGLIDASLLGQLKEIQTIKYVSKIAEDQGYKEGMDIMFNPDRYAMPYQKKSLRTAEEENAEYFDKAISYNLKVIKVNNEELIQIITSDVTLIIEDYEMIEVEDSFISSSEPKKKSNLILPRDKKIITEC